MTREEARDWLMAISFVSDPHIAEAIDMAIEALRAEAVEVVRCKDCNGNYYDGDSIYCLRLSCGHHGHTIQRVEEDFFCKYGERKE